MPVPVDPSVLALTVYPATDEPGVPLESAAVSAAGLAGDRPKKAPVSLVGADHAADVRANIVLDLPTERLEELIGRELAVGDVRLGIARTAGNCPGVYADVLDPGTVTRGDRVTVD